MNTTIGIDGTSCRTVNATFPLPDGFALCCPSCNVWKMRPEVFMDQIFWRCSGPASEAHLLPRVQPGKGIGTICGKIHSDEAIRSFIGLQMVEE
jgi:hypothetical protein